MNLYAIWVVLELSLTGAGVLMFLWGLVTRWKVELVLPLVLVGGGSIILSFAYLLAVLIQDQICLHLC